MDACGCGMLLGYSCGNIGHRSPSSLDFPKPRFLGDEEFHELNSTRRISSHNRVCMRGATAAAFTCALAVLIAGGAPGALINWMVFTSQPFSPELVPPAPDYTKAASWASSPLFEETHRSWWVPPTVEPVDAAHARFDVFWIHPTTYFFGTWNAAVDSPLTNLITNVVPVREQAGPFNGECRIFAPRYRQLSQGVQDRFPREEQQAAMNVAFSDVWAAFQHFLNHTEGRPFFIGSYSQGTLHAMRLLKQWLPTASTKETTRFVAWYGIGNTVPETEMATTLHVCRAPREVSCYVSYNTVLTGDVEGSAHWRAKGKPTCVNPLSWRQNGAVAGMDHHLGAVPLMSSAGPGWRLLFYPFTRMFSPAPPDRGLVTAQCEDGILYISDPAANETVGHRYEFNPGGAMHAFDINLFWINLRTNIRERGENYLSLVGAPKEGV